MKNRKQELRPLFAFGGLTCALYFLLFYFEAEVVALTSQGGWTFLLPVAIAFAFSYGHGNFTAAFWDWLGIRARN